MINSKFVLLLVTVGAIVATGLVVSAQTSSTEREAGPRTDRGPGEPSAVTVLSESLHPLRDHFNAHQDKHRFVAILSPT